MLNQMHMIIQMKTWRKKKSIFIPKLEDDEPAGTTAYDADDKLSSKGLVQGSQIGSAAASQATCIGHQNHSNTLPANSLQKHLQNIKN